jgi:hypothetical protein
MNEQRNEKLQAVCRDYLKRLRPVAERFGLGGFVDGLISANTRNECAGTEEDVELLARCADEERLSRQEVPQVLGKSYRQCNDDGDFERIKKLRRVGIYSKTSTILGKKD